MFNHWDVVLDFVKACVRMTVIWVFSTILAIVLDSWGIRAENLLLVYLVLCLCEFLVVLCRIQDVDVNDRTNLEQV